MIVKELMNGWSMHQVGDTGVLPAQVPGSVYNDLLACGKMEDPYYRDNELEALKIMEHDFEYTTIFAVEAELLREEQILLAFEGVDTLADIYLNGVHLAYVNNMHRSWEFPVKKYL
ncbi:MAG: glycoside hydrolase family 2 protein, partial [Lachnospiraceae bacterium]|nr:glycoside hydrolase family 2 protein [Lachnospiraceae bacterium]